jgi:hypothetical protein
LHLFGSIPISIVYAEDQEVAQTDNNKEEEHTTEPTFLSEIKKELDWENNHLEETILDLSKKVNCLFGWTKCMNDCRFNPFTVTDSYCYHECKKELQEE